MLDNRDVDAVTIAAPDHWHALMTILACQAGKDVYVEKPISHNIVEGRRMIEAARRSNRIVQVGTQARSGRLLAKAVQFVRDGGLGTIHMGKTVINRPRDPIGVAADSRCRPACTTTCGWDRRRSTRSTSTAFTTTGTGSGTTARAISGTPPCTRWTRRAGCLASRSILERCTAVAARTKTVRRPISRRRTRNPPRISMRTGRSCTATCGTGSADHRRRGAFSSTAPRAG